MLKGRFTAVSFIQYFLSFVFLVKMKMTIVLTHYSDTDSFWLPVSRGSTKSSPPDSSNYVAGNSYNLISFKDNLIISYLVIESSLRGRDIPPKPKLVVQSRLTAILIFTTELLKIN